MEVMSCNSIVVGSLDYQESGLGLFAPAVGGSFVPRIDLESTQQCTVGNIIIRCL